MSREEDNLQKRCINLLIYRYAHLGRCWHHSPNEGKRSERYGANLKAMGMTPGWPDLEIMLPSGKYHGLFIEFKTPKGRQTPEQKNVQHILESNGYRYELCRSYEQFQNIAHEYLGNEKDPDIEALRKILLK